VSGKGLLLSVEARRHEVAFLFWIEVLGFDLRGGARVDLVAAGRDPVALGRVEPDGTFVAARVCYCYQLPITVCSTTRDGGGIAIMLARAPGCSTPTTHLAWSRLTDEPGELAARAGSELSEGPGEVELDG
jgi:hypothetical protein